MSKLAHSNQKTMNEIEARAREDAGETFDMEDEATQFAAHLLVPEQLLSKELDKIGPKDIDDEKHIEVLCKKFKVSRGLMQYRLRLRSLPLPPADGGQE